MRTHSDGVLRCSACHLELPTACFSYTDQLRGTLNSYCRTCHAGYRHGHYLANKADYVRRAIAQVRQRRIVNRREVMRYLRTHPCVDCGISNLVVLEFDHRDPDLKLMDVGTMMISRRWPRVLAEIEKCDVRCANCHRRRTARSLGGARPGAINFDRHAPRVCCSGNKEASQVSIAGSIPATRSETPRH